MNSSWLCRRSREGESALAAEVPFSLVHCLRRKIPVEHA